MVQSNSFMVLQLAFEAHDGQKRRSGEPFIVHPVEVARILGELVSSHILWSIPLLLAQSQFSICLSCTFQISLASLLFQELDWESIAAGLLHDTVEDTNVVTFERIEKEFGTTVRRIVEGETKVVYYSWNVSSLVCIVRFL